MRAISRIKNLIPEIQRRITSIIPKRVTPSEDIHSHKISVYLGIKISLLACVTLLTAFANDRFSLKTIQTIYSFTLFSFLFTYLFSIWFNELKKVNYFLLSQIVYDVLYTGALIYYTGRTNSVFVFLFPITIIYAAILLGKRAALITAIGSGIFFASLANFTFSTEAGFEAYLHSIAYLLTAILTGTLVEEAQKNKEKALEHEKSLDALQKFNNIIIQNMNAGLVLLNENHEIIDANKRLRFWFENDIKKLNDWLNQHEKDLFDSSAFDLHEPLIYEIGQTNDKKTIQLTRIQFKDEENKEKTAFFIYDMTEILKLEKENSMNQRLASVGELAAGIAHEIRNPLAGISGAAEFLSGSELKKGSHEEKLLNNIIKESDRLNRLIESFLNYSKPHKGNFQIVNLNQLISEIIENLKNRDPQNCNITYQVEIPEGTEIFAPTDILKQAILNVIINATDALNEDGTKSHKLFKCKVTKDDLNTYIELSNNGTMIPPTKQEKIFEPFYTSKSKGTGLGLATAYSNLKESGCSLSLAHSNENETEFLIKIPAKNASLHKIKAGEKVS